MRIEQTRWSPDRGWLPNPPGSLAEPPQLVLAFGGTSVLQRTELLDEVRGAYGQAHLLGCSTAGEIFGTRVSDDTLVVTAVRFDHTRLHGARIRIHSAEESFAAGCRPTAPASAGRWFSSTAPPSPARSPSSAFTARGSGSATPRSAAGIRSGRSA